MLTQPVEAALPQLAVGLQPLRGFDEGSRDSARRKGNHGGGRQSPYASPRPPSPTRALIDP